MDKKIVDAIQKIYEDINAHVPGMSAKIICKSEDDDQRLFYAVVVEPMTDVTPEGDSHGHVMSAEEVEKSAHYYMEMGSTIFKGHQSKVDVSVVESYIAPVNFSITGRDEDIITKGTWVMAVKVHDDETWEEIKSGEITAFSPGGYGNLVDLDDD